MPDKLIPLGKSDKFAIVDEADFDWLNQFSWHYHNLGYVRNWKFGYMHKLINATPTGYQTDHINQNKLDNRRANLRTVTASENQANKPISRNNTSGIPGIRWDSSRNLWKVSFRRNKRTHNVGNFKDKSRAILRLQEAMSNV